MFADADASQWLAKCNRIEEALTQVFQEERVHGCWVRNLGFLFVPFSSVIVVETWTLSMGANDLVAAGLRCRILRPQIPSRFAPSPSLQMFTDHAFVQEGMTSKPCLCRRMTSQIFN
jgi:hypothetical protein